MTEDKILAKAKRIIAKRNKNTERIEICLLAGLCPNCGKPGEPKRRGNNTIYRFECLHCGSKYLKYAGRDDEWQEFLKPKTKNEK